VEIRVEGTKELTEKLRLLSTPKEYIGALRESVRMPMKQVFKKAKANLSRISPGKREIHRTYKGRLVSSGFALRSLRMIVATGKEKESASAVLGVRKEAFYVLQFFELGTAHISAQPWLQPAFYSSRQEMVNGTGDGIKAYIEKIARKRST